MAKGGRNRLEATPFFFVFGRFFVFFRFITTSLEKKVELVSRARILKPNVGAERETDRKKERKKEEESIHSSVLRGRSPRSPPTIAVKKNMMGKRETFFN